MERGATNVELRYHYSQKKKPMSIRAKNILFRADSSSKIGTGHIMRDLVLAEQFKDANIIFATQALPGNINHKIKEKGYAVELLDSNGVEALGALIKKYNISMVVIDHYGIDYAFEKQLKARTGVKLFVLDDTYERHDCDILLNHNVYAKPDRYATLVPHDCELRCGRNFILLRDEFPEAKKKKSLRSDSASQKLHVFVAMGGTDHRQFSIEILKVLEIFPNIHAEVVTTAANGCLDALEKYVTRNIAATLHVDTPNIAELMAFSDFAIITPSVVLNEVLYMDLPFVAIQTADNQKEMTRYLEANSFPILEHFDKKRLQQAVTKMMDFVSIEYVNYIDLSDAEKSMVLQWRNHDNVRKWMHNTEPIALRHHLAFIDSLKRSKNRIYLLVKQRGIAIGVIDFTVIDRDRKSAHIGLFSDPAVKGNGTKLMQSIIIYGFYRLGFATMEAEVYEKNAKARKLYEKFGFRETSRTGTEAKRLLHMERHICG